MILTKPDSNNEKCNLQIELEDVEWEDNTIDRNHLATLIKNIP